MRSAPLAAVTLCAAVALGGSYAATAAAPQKSVHWVGAWQAAPESGGPASSDKSYRALVHPAIGGSALRLRFSNSYGKTPVSLRNITVALPLGGQPGPAIDPSSARLVTKTLVIPAGKEAFAPAISFPVPADGWISVSFHAPGTFAKTTYHNIGMSSSWSSPDGAGDTTADMTGTSFTIPSISYVFLQSLDVLAPKTISTVVVLGDSITDCCWSGPDTNKRWTDLLNQRLAQLPGGRRHVVVNAAMVGNNVSNDRDGNQDQGAAGFSRVGRDVFAEPSVSTMIVFEGINDVGTGVKAATIISTYQRIVAEAHRRGIRVVIATLTPCKQAYTSGGSYISAAAVRDKVNDWVWAHPTQFDGVIPFDRAVANPTDPQAWNAAYMLDGLHPNPLGLQAMANAVPLSTLG